MPSRSEAALTALHLRLSAIEGVDVRRNEPLPTEVPDGGLLILRDGDPGEPDVTMSPLLYHFEHTAELEMFVDDTDADAAFDTLRLGIAAALASDRTLGGLVDWLEASAPAPVDLPIPGAASVKAASIPIRLFYASPDPLT